MPGKGVAAVILKHLDVSDVMQWFGHEHSQYWYYDDVPMWQHRACTWEHHRIPESRAFQSEDAALAIDAAQQVTCPACAVLFDWMLSEGQP